MRNIRVKNDVPNVAIFYFRYFSILFLNIANLFVEKRELTYARMLIIHQFLEVQHKHMHKKCVK